MSEEKKDSSIGENSNKKTVSFTIATEKEGKGLVITIISISIAYTVGCGVLIFKNISSLLGCSFLAITLILWLSIFAIIYVSYLEYREKIYRTTMSTAKVIMALEKQKDNSAVQPARIEKITLGGKALISIGWQKDTNQNNFNQGNEKLGK